MERNPWLQSKWCTLNLAIFTWFTKAPNILVIRYCPPSSNELYLTEFCHQLEVIRNKYSNSALWIGGDANLLDIDWSTNRIQLLYTYIFLDFLHTNALIQRVYFPNRGPNILDIFITNRSWRMQYNRWYQWSWGSFLLHLLS